MFLEGGFSFPLSIASYFRWINIWTAMEGIITVGALDEAR